MTEYEYEGALRKGLGRAITCLTPELGDRFRHLILEACVDDWRYDRQCEESRSVYLFEIVQAAGLQAECREALFHRLLTSEIEDVYHENFRLALEFARRGDPEMRDAMYRGFDRCAQVVDFTGGDELIQLDGLDGLLHAAKLLLPRQSEAHWWEFGSWISELEKREGKENARKQLDDAAQTWPELAEALAAEQAEETKLEATREAWRKPPPPMSWPQVRAALLENRRPAGFRPWVWARDVDATVYRQAAEDVVAEADLNVKWKLLHVFAKRAFPLDPAPLLQMVEHAEPRLACRAANVLTNVRHPSVRAAAIRYAAKAETFDRASRLLESNCEETDAPLLTELIERSESDNMVHSVGFSVKDIAENCPWPGLDRPLLLLYERDPCSMCRCGVVRELMKRDALRDALRDECRFDAYLSTRELVAHGPDHESERGP